MTNQPPSPARTAESSTRVLPPKETFWQRYSPRHEMPVSGAMSIFIHGMVIGFVVLLAWWMSLPRFREKLAPPAMEVVQVEGEGFGLPGGGGPAGLPGSKGPEETAFVAKLPATPETPSKFVAPDTKLEEIKPGEVDLSQLPVLDPEQRPSLSEDLKQIQRLAAEQVKKDIEAAKGPVKVAAQPGGGNGVGEKGGKSKGPGQGDLVGPGTDKGGVGRKATRAEILAWRWRFDLTGSGAEHADKLAAIGVTLAIPDGRGGFRVIRDLQRRPAVPVQENLAPYKDAVKWYNTKPDSINALAKALRLPYVPQYLVLLLPKDREEKMAEEERKFAEDRGRSVKTVTATWFDFQLRNGAYEPVVIRQE
jgi:hypothetical protein